MLVTNMTFDKAGSARQLRLGAELVPPRALLQRQFSISAPSSTIEYENILADAC